MVGPVTGALAACLFTLGTGVKAPLSAAANSTCGSDGFICRTDGRCVQTAKYCDGREHCLDSSVQCRESKAVEGLILIIIGLTVLILMTIAAILLVCKTNACAKQSHAEVPGGVTVVQARYQSENSADTNIRRQNRTRSNDRFLMGPDIHPNNLQLPAYTEAVSESVMLDLPPPYEEAIRPTSVEAESALSETGCSENGVDYASCCPGHQQEGRERNTHQTASCAEGFNAPESSRVADQNIPQTEQNTTSTRTFIASNITLNSHEQAQNTSTEGALSRTRDSPILGANPESNEQDTNSGCVRPCVLNVAENGERSSPGGNSLTFTRC